MPRRSQRQFAQWPRRSSSYLDGTCLCRPRSSFCPRTSIEEPVELTTKRSCRVNYPSLNMWETGVDRIYRCPVCNRNLDTLGSAAEQEIHVKTCLEGGGISPQTAKYLVYSLPPESTLIGIECKYSPKLTAASHIGVGVICLEEFLKGSMVARLSCLCSFHNSEPALHVPCCPTHCYSLACLSSWLQRGKSCPVHAR